jgi:hypothetical protein
MMATEPLFLPRFGAIFLTTGRYFRNARPISVRSALTDALLSRTPE